MPGWAKALIIVAILGLLTVVGVIAAGVYWWSQNKDALIGRARAEVTEGRDAGLNTDNQGCVDLSISRYKAEPGFTSTITVGLFMRSCLESSKTTPGFCDEVPVGTEFLKSAEWRLAQCKRVDLTSDQYCQQLFAQVQVFCETPRSKQSSSPEP